MADVISKMVIEGTRYKVSAFAADPDNAPLWYVNIKSVEWKTPKPLTVGSRVAFKATFLGRELAYIYEIQSYLPGEYLVMRTTEGPFPMKTSYEWHSVSDHSCEMILRNAGRPSGFSRLFSPFIKMAMRRANKKNLERLKSIIEKTNDKN